MASEYGRPMETLSVCLNSFHSHFLILFLYIFLITLPKKVSDAEISLIIWEKIELIFDLCVSMYLKVKQIKLLEDLDLDSSGFDFIMPKL